jgi:hypothetical protein
VRTSPPADRRPSRRQVSFAALLAGLLGGCFTSTEGEPPPTDELYFPVGLSLFGDTLDTEGKPDVDDAGRSVAPRFLAVANSDYDLHYNSGNVFVLDAARIRELTPDPCDSDDDCEDEDYPTCDTIEVSQPPSYTCIDKAKGPCRGGPERSPADRSLYPGRCESQPIDEALRSSVKRIGAFATDVLYQPNPDTSDAEKMGRLFVPVRGDATLHWIDVQSDGGLECGDDDGACDDFHRVGDDPDEENTRDLRLDPEPFALAASSEGPAIVVTNRTTGKASLFVNDWATRPALKHALEGLPAFPVGIAALPAPALVPALEALHAEPREGTPLADVAARWDDIGYAPGFLVSFANARQINLLRYFQQDPAQNEDYLRLADTVGIYLNAPGYDSRGIAIQARERRAAELRCASRNGVTLPCDSTCIGGLAPEALDSYLRCVDEAASTPVDVYVANRSPASLLVGRTRPVVNDVQTAEVPDFYAAIPLTLGPSRVVTGDVIVDNDGAKGYEPRVFAICFDSRRIFVYDPVRRMIDTEITTGRGPHAVAIDPVNGLLFVGHFTDSYIGVVSIDRRFPQTYGRTLATIGKPVPPRTSK